MLRLSTPPNHVPAFKKSSIAKGLVESNADARAADVAGPRPKVYQENIKPRFDDLPDSAFARLSQLVQSPKRPNAHAPLPFSAPTLWRKVKNHTFVQPVRLSKGVTAFNVGAVRAWIEAQMTGQSVSE